MKPNYKFIASILSACILLASGCTKKLEEKPFTVFSPEYFKTPSGFNAGINAAYSGLRFLFGPEGAVGVGVVGTDEWTFADQPRTASGATEFRDVGRYAYDNSVGSILTPWNRSFNNINLANAIVEYAPEVAIPDAEKKVLLGEIRFIRALYYLNLVSQFGAVPVDLGSGDLKFNQAPFQGFNRLPVAEVLVKDYQAIIEDLIFATQNCPDKRPANAFRVGKAAAFHLLSKAYIHRAYSAAKQTSDFANAYTAAMEVINNQARYGVALLENYADIHRPSNDYNAEILFSIERVPGNNIANEVSNPQGIGGDKGTDANNDFVAEYTAVRAPLVSSATSPCGTRTVLYGRPIRRFCPTAWTYNVAFADKDNDARYDGSFRTAWLATQTGGGYTSGVDTGFVLAKTNRIADSLNGVAPAGPRLKPYRVIAPREFYIINGIALPLGTAPAGTQNIYPSLSKYEDPAKIAANDKSTRPFPVSKLSELYLMAAEAAIGTNQPAQALPLIKTLRERAAFRPGLSVTDLNTRKAIMGAKLVNGVPQLDGSGNPIAMTAADMTLDFILDERVRELCGESTRWPDLAVRGKLIERAKLYNPDAAPTITINKHELRPIPRSQLDAVADPNKAQYQNPGW
jgi:hypothetical protein